jgi:RsiW-degrading membrane proteinase PrsW (M82 family)
MKFIIDLLGTKTGVSHKRFISVLFAVMLVIFAFLLYFFPVPEQNEGIFNQILYIFSGVILFQSGASVFEKKDKVD